jgi:hypothetical protein
MIDIRSILAAFLHLLAWLMLTFVGWSERQGERTNRKFH